MNNRTPRSLTGSIADLQRNEAMRILKESEEIIAELDPGKITERRKFPEEQFRRNFLPLVTGEAYEKLPPGYTPERLHDEAFNLWCQVSGGPTNEVDVVEPDGTVAFTVPALMDTSIMNIAQPTDRAGLRALNKEYIERSPGLPHVAKARMQAGLAQQIAYMFQNTPDPRETSENIKRIHNYYGITKPAGEEPKNKVAENNYMGEFKFD